MLKYNNVREVRVQDWNKLVIDTYVRPYNLQQQDGCKPRGVEALVVPSYDINEDEYVHKSIDETDTDGEMGVFFEAWLERKIDKEIPNQRYSFELKTFWHRRFYPMLQVVANDLFERGLVEQGRYLIVIDW